jgi:folate-binding protein YgfZ
MGLESPLIEIHRAAGAEFSPYFGVTLPAQFRDPVAEHQTARTTAALMDTNFRSVFSLTGPDRVRYLNAVTSGNIRDLPPGQSTMGLLLNAQGHILAELETLALEDRLLVLGHAFRRQETAATLEKFIIMDDATLADETAQWGTVAIEGPEAPRALHDLTGVTLAQLPAQGHAATAIRLAGGTIPCRVIHHSLFGFPGAEIVVERDHLPALWRAADEAVRARGGASIGYLALNMLRLEAGVPWFGADFDEHYIPQEAALESTHISFTKGCYTGQEIVERVRRRGRVHRRRTGLQLDRAEVPGEGSPPSRMAGGKKVRAEAPEPGATLLADGTEVGHITSAAFSPLLNRALAMGYVRTEYTQPGTILQCGSASAEVIELPLPAAVPASA